MARFGKNLVFLAYFKNKEQLDAARTLNKDADKTWIIHGKLATKEKQAIVTPAIIYNVSTDEMVDVVNKYTRKNLLDEVPQNIMSTSIKNYASPEKVVDVILDLRAEINKEYAMLVANLKEGKKKIDEEKTKRDALQKKVDERQKLLDEIKIKKEPEVETNKSTKQVSPIELHEFKLINESCRKRLVTKTYTEEDKVR
ncbi:hypothetical protein RhiirA5_437727 [Rhizophagus irregularis]|uniref:Uncharacterized protein n=1 Tax=Rhizophagus irregularis TaxID=588596 RepID=A0A2N0NK36_9GLOM|nr:hypothetical protein RhiirA5_437727 [Rhizophagus irregularis]